MARALPFQTLAGTEMYRLLQRRGLQYAVLSGLVAVLSCAGIVLLIERSNGGTIDDYGTALWWAVVTVTTVGYGDSVPVSDAGRVVAVFLMLVGISLFSWVTASVAAFLLEFRDRRNGKAVTMSDLMEKLEALEEEIRLLRTSQDG